MRRPFADTLLDLLAGATPSPELSAWIRVTSLSLDLPVEIQIQRSPGHHGDWEVVADVPRWRWQTDFDPPRGRLQITWKEEVSA
jgi:hypothetical protein